MAFLPGLLATLGPMLPGIVSTIGDIAGKVFNRPAGKGIGETLLEAAPTALKAVSGIASSLAPGLGGTAGKVLGTIGNVANALTPAPSAVEDHKAEMDRIHRVSNIIESSARDAYRKWAETAWPGEDVGEVIYKLLKDSDFLRDMDTAIPQDYDRILTRYISQTLGNPGLKSMSTNATDHMPIVHGPSTQAHMPMLGHPQNQSGPMELQGVSPAQAYQNESTKTMGPTALSGNERFMLQKTAYDRAVEHSISPEALVNYKGERVPVQRTQVESHGASPSFSPFDKLAPRPIEEQKTIIETMPPTDDRDELLLKAMRIINKRTVKKAAKKQKKRGRK